MELVAGWDRPFRVWHYSVSYRQLLMRSLADVAPKRVDVLFSNVRFFHGPTDFDRLEIHTGADFTPPGAPEIGGAPGRWFVLNAESCYLYGTHCQWHEDDGNAMTPSRFGPLKRTD
ncbi:hypothetical protein OG216_36820 [Streptomycetaceae bacterium NBC_01309]